MCVYMRHVLCHVLSCVSVVSWCYVCLVLLSCVDLVCCCHMCWCSHHPFPPIPQLVRYQSRVLMGLERRGSHVLLSCVVVICWCQHHLFPPIPQPVRYQFSRVVMGWGEEAILGFRLSSFLIGTHNSIDHACRCAIPIHRQWLSQRPLGMTASSPARPGVNPHTRWLHQLSLGMSLGMTASSPWTSQSPPLMLMPCRDLACQASIHICNTCSILNVTQPPAHITQQMVLLHHVPTLIEKLNMAPATALPPWVRRARWLNQLPTRKSRRRVTITSRCH